MEEGHTTGAQQSDANQDGSITLHVEDDQKQQDAQHEGGQSLEDYENHHLALVQAKKTRPSASLKRPASANAAGPSKAIKKAEAKAKATSKAQAKAKAKAKSELRWGCTRCRGNVRGCDSCNFDGFRGVRLNGREAWLKYCAEKKAKNAKKTKK